MSKIYYYINGKWIDSSNATIPFNDSGFLYGDGLFETMRFDNGKIFYPQKHLKRLEKSLKIIELKFNKSQNQILDILNRVISKNKINSGIIRMMITRGSTEQDDCPGVYISIKPFYDIPTAPVRVIYLDESKFPIIRFTPAIKSMNYIGNMLAKKETNKLNAFEPIFFNIDNIITECAIRNIFYIKDKTLLTPSLDLGILSGVMRNTILDIAKKLDIFVKETHIRYEDIKDMDESFISSTGIGLLECYWDGWESNYNRTKQIKKELFKRIKNN